MSMTLYDWKNSYNSRKIRAVAFECDLRIDPVAIDMQAGQNKTPEFLAMNPNGKVPVLKDGPVVLWESNAIMCYVAAQDPTHRLLPTDAQGRAKVDQWLFWQTAHLSPSIGKVSYEKIWKGRFGLGTPDATAIVAAMPEINRYVGVLESQLSKNPWVTGSDLSVVDFAGAASFSLRQEIELNLTAYPAVMAWLTKVEARPSWQNAAW